SRAGPGSSAKVRLFTVPANTTVEVSIYMKCPSSSANYWMECGCRAGNFAASDFDTNGAAWTMIQKFDSTGGQNGNGNTWTRYSVTISTGSSTQLSVGLKAGSSGG